MKLLTSLVPLTIIVLAAAGCVREREVFFDQTTQIELQSGMWSKDAGASTLEFEVQVGGWEGDVALADWSVAPSWVSTSQVKASTTPTNMILSPARPYNYLGMTTSIRAWAPVGTISSGRVDFLNPAGAVDVMLTWVVSGTMKVPIYSSLQFRHLTTQLRFVAVDAAGSTDELVTSVVLRNIELPVGIDLTTDRLVSAGKKNLAISALPIAGVLPTPQGVALGSAVMVLPTDTNALRADIVTTTRSYSNVLITTTDPHFVAGRSYTVTLNFKRAQGESIKATSAINPWSEGKQGEGVVF